jgi:SAM-dependent methyltransferase
MHSAHPRAPGVGRQPFVEAVAALYDEAGDDYLTYADGDPEKLFWFEGLHACADRQLWSPLAAKLRALRASGADRVHLLDAGCGPGTRLCRCVIHAQALGFSNIEALGFDLSQAQVAKPG